mmetsp:Transcript_74471/g.116504  ORF Transcript_74471/g.116504 Transcript_74471/m.116504 type:complete len:569 (-) Transcript_74471:85-1791(-)
MMNVVLFACVIQVFFKLSVARLALGADGDLDYTCRDEFCRAKGGEALLQVKQSLMFEKSLPKRSYDGLEELEDWMDKRSQHQLSWEEFTRPDKSYSEDRSHHVTPSVKKKKKKVQEFEAAKKIFSGIEPYEKAPAAHAPQAASAPPSTPPVAVSGRPAAPAPAAASVPPSTHHLLPRRATPGLRRAKNPPSTPPAVMSAPPAAPPAPAPVPPSLKQPLSSDFPFPALSQEEDDALLAELCKKVKTDDPSSAEIIDPAIVCCDPRQWIYAIHTEPKIYLVPNFISDEECNHLLELSRANWAPTLVMTAGPNGSPDDLKQKSSTLRTSHGSVIDYAATPMVADIEKRLSNLAGMDVNHLERLVMVRYQEGQEYKIHHDGTWRLVTIFIYLNDLDEDAEGETFFPNLDIKIKPRKGCAVMWPNTCGVASDGTHLEDTRVMHAGLPPIGCTKFGVNCFFNVAPKRLQPDENGQGPPPRVPKPSHSARFPVMREAALHMSGSASMRDLNSMPGRSRRSPPAFVVRPVAHPHMPTMAAIAQPMAAAFPHRACPRSGIRCGAPAIDMRSPFQVLA